MRLLIICFLRIHAIFRSLRVRVRLAEEPRIVTQVKTLGSVVDEFGIERGTCRNFVLFRAFLQDLLERVLGHVVPKVDHLEAVLELYDPLNVKSLRWVALEALHNQHVDDGINRLAWWVQGHFQNVLLRLLHRCALKRVDLRDKIVQRATQGPCFCLLGELKIGVFIFLLRDRTVREYGRIVYNFGCRVTHMARIVRALQKFFEVVGQTNHVELAQAVVVVQACRVHVTVNDSQGVKVSDRAGKLTEN